MKYSQICILTLALASAIFVAFASEDGGIIFTKEDAKQTKYLDPSTADVNISFEDAKNKLISENSEVTDESIHGELIDDENFGIIWRVSSKTTNGKSIFAGIDASNGEQLFVYDGSKNVQGRDSISKDDALKIAEEYIVSRVSADKINDLEFEHVNYIEPAADDLPGTYKISYARIIRGIPSLSDGIQVRINAETGEVSSYRKRWSMDKGDIALIDTEPGITDEKAVEILKEFMSNELPIGEEKASTVKVISSNLVWKEDDEDKTRLAWRIQFRDSSFAKDSKYPASVLIDAHSGEMLLFDYSRN
ncbi:YcdB/YcdC domain-containing protein [Methanosarcina sp.]|uniref:YcdB/YcdC domain-containing protein n=1 Tax=Methanosarcina sp. TaxID=2213 RepID=UPI002AB807E6|nr:YcdB/YcdC domain-containing protein [Methanosarcina sp.]MDY9927065.1 PepSY domain-containing protein [Methanosarcina sp.]